MKNNKYNTVRNRGKIIDNIFYVKKYILQLDKTKVLFPQAYVTLADVCYPV
jgi:hypothetical protein